MCIVDLSKTLMYDFRYNYIKKNSSIVSYYLLTLTLFFIRLPLKETVMKNSGKTGLYLTILNIQNLLSIFLKKTKK